MVRGPLTEPAYRDPTPGSAGNPILGAAKSLMSLGFLIGFPLSLLSAAIGTAGHYRIYSNSNATRPTATLTHLIYAKSRAGYVEEDYARRYELAERLAPYFWLLSAPGFVALALGRRAGARGRVVRRRPD